MSEMTFGPKKTDPPTSGDHKDYQKNFTFAEQFIINCTGKLPPGMKVYIADSDGLKKSIVVTCFLPEKKDTAGNFAAPISLHQWHEAFKKEFKEIFNEYFNMAKKWEARSQKLVIFSKVQEAFEKDKIQSEMAQF